MAIALLTLALTGTVSLVLTLVYGHRIDGDGSLVRPHFLLALTSTFLLVMGHSFIMFFLLATGVEMKELERKHALGDSFRRRTIAMKSKVFPAMTLAVLLVMANFILGAAAHTRVIPGWLHGALAWTTLLVCLYTLYREYQVLGENNRLIAEIGALRQRATPFPPEGSEEGG